MNHAAGRLGTVMRPHAIPPLITEIGNQEMWVSAFRVRHPAEKRDDF